MVGDTPILDMSYVAGEDLSLSQFRAVSMGRDGCMYVVSTSPRTVGGVTVPSDMWGILQNDPPAGDIAVVRELGHSKCVMNGIVHPGDGLILADTVGRLGTGTYGSSIIVAKMSQDACGGAGEIHDVSLMARNAQGASYRAGQLTYKVTGIQLRTTASNIFSAGVPLGFTGAIMDMFAIVETVTNTSSATATLKLAISGTTVTGLELDFVEADTSTLSKVIPSTKTTVGANAFGPADTLAVAITQGGTQYGTGDTGILKLYVITN